MKYNSFCKSVFFVSGDIIEVHNPQQDATATDLSILPSGGGQRLENFLRAGLQVAVAPLSIESPAAASRNMAITAVAAATGYDSELKAVAASFLRGFDADAEKQAVAVPVVGPAPKKTGDSTFGQRTSIYRGVTRHRWTGRYEAHLWDNSCRREGQSRKGRQGGYDKEEKAARAYDLAALKYWGPATTTNFPISDYEKELEEMQHMTRQEFVASLRRKSSGFSRGASIYRGVTRHHQHGRWQARIGRVAGNKDLYLGTFSTQEEAAEAYDIAAIKFRGLNAVTNFDITRYDVQSIASNNLPVGGVTSKSTAGSRDNSINENQQPEKSSLSMVSCPKLCYGIPIKQDTSDYWSFFGFQTQNSSQTQNLTISSGVEDSANQTNCQGTTVFNMDFSTGASIVNEAESGFLSVGSGVGGGSSVYAEQQISNSSSSSNTVGCNIHYGIPMVDLSNVGGRNDYEGGSSSWVGPALHLQTPIFGME
ncbi:hypothetical protein Nepgr_019802 [Nepenthes gracilis]|uniref:AP2/ERF domain-containing protein n=1 Tax=Nepenthes gracilis TaxID=150966 RepID=A0AAD3SXR9_NEPGR|nr:hypothetical protein Nepgr_019802 [Nepenthes gracilis]